MLGRMRVDDLRKLYLEELKDAYDAEHQILDALPKMSDAAHNTELKNAFRQHLEETRSHVRRLEEVFQRAGERPDRRTCKGMKGILHEGEEMVKAKGLEDAIDAGLIAAAQRVEHYEMALYGTLRSYAQTLGREEEARLLQQILDEEGAADRKLTQIAESTVNIGAAESIRS
jgi:ferritin-like metal-binding protein YciE